jgi:hypothetical protein
LATKLEELNDPNSTLNKAADDEPIFILRAQDMTAPQTVLEWMQRNPQIGEAKFAEARDCADAMRAWPERRKAD